jgi:cytoskeleton protein RodZ
MQIEPEFEVNDTQTIGQLLKASREEKNLSLEHTSSQLYLASEKLKQLENGEWDKLGSRIYARGYFTSYIKLLGLNESEMLKRFDDEYPLITQEKALSKPRVSVEKTAYWRIALYLVAFLAMLLGGYQLYKNSVVANNVEVSTNGIISEHFQVLSANRFQLIKPFLLSSC